MNLLSLATLNVSGCTILKVEIIDQQLVIHFHYNQSIDNITAELKWNFDQEFVRSPQAKIIFPII